MYHYTAVKSRKKEVTDTKQETDQEDFQKFTDSEMDTATNTYLRDNPHLRHVVLCLDADRPGQEAAQKLRAKYEQRGLKVSIRAPPKGKDWNEFLQQCAPPRERGW